MIFLQHIAVKQRERNEKTQKNSKKSCSKRKREMYMMMAVEC